MEDRLGIEPRPYGLKARYSTSELPVHFIGGFGGTRTLKPDGATDFKSVAYASSAMVPKKWWASWGSNPVPPVYETGALTE